MKRCWNCKALQCSAVERMGSDRSPLPSAAASLPTLMDATTQQHHVKELQGQYLKGPGLGMLSPVTLYWMYSLGTWIWSVIVMFCCGNCALCGHCKVALMIDFELSENRQSGCLLIHHTWFNSQNKVLCDCRLHRNPHWCSQPHVSDIITSSRWEKGWSRKELMPQ